MSDRRPENDRPPTDPAPDEGGDSQEEFTLTWNPAMTALLEILDDECIATRRKMSDVNAEPASPWEYLRGFSDGVEKAMEILHSRMGIPVNRQEWRTFGLGKK